ncbi:unnamed protein product [Urochloa humidicola]
MEAEGSGRRARRRLPSDPEPPFPIGAGTYGQGVVRRLAEAEAEAKAEGKRSKGVAHPQIPSLSLAAAAAVLVDLFSPRRASSSIVPWMRWPQVVWGIRCC